MKAAPAVVRATRALDFFVAHPGQPFTLTEVAERLDLRPGTLLSILQALTDRGYLARHPRHKTYVLGPALIAAGHAALLPHPIADVARHEVLQLAEKTGIECAASLAIGNYLVLVAAAGRSPSTDPMLVWRGAHLPLRQPFGAPFVAWTDDDTIAHWIGVEYRQRAPDRAARLELMVAEVRVHGYALGVFSAEEAEPLSHALTQARAHARSARTPQDETSAGRSVSLMIDDAETESLRSEIDLGIQQLSDQIVALNLGERSLGDATTVAVPVFGPAGDVVLALTAHHGFPRPLDDESLHGLVDQLNACAARITNDTFARGRR